MTLSAQNFPISQTPRVTGQLRVLLVDVADLVHWGFRSVLRGEAWVEHLVAAHDSAMARELVRRYRPHVAVISYPMPGDSGANLCEDLKEDSSATRVLLMADGGLTPTSAGAMGADGLVPKTWPARDIAGAARAVALGTSFVAPDFKEPARVLTRREQSVLEMIAAGSTNREIAADLQLSTHTVKDHVSTLLRKIGARNRAEAIQRGQRLGLIA